MGSDEAASAVGTPIIADAKGKAVCRMGHVARRGRRVTVGKQGGGERTRRDGEHSVGTYRGGGSAAVREEVMEGLTGGNGRERARGAVECTDLSAAAAPWDENRWRVRIKRTWGWSKERQVCSGTAVAESRSGRNYTTPTALIISTFSLIPRSDYPLCVG